MRTSRILIVTLLALVGGAALHAQMSGTYRIANGNPNGVFDYGDIGAAFDDLEANGVSGPVTLEIYDDGGTFTSTTSYLLGNSAVAGLGASNPLVITAPGSERPVVSGSAAFLAGSFNNVTFTIGVTDLSYVTIEGLEITGGVGTGLYLHAVVPMTNITVRRCRVHGVTGGPGMLLYGNNNGTLDNWLIENNFVWDCEGSGALWQNFVVGAIAPRRAVASTVIRHNTVVHNSGGGTSAAFGYLGGSNGTNDFTFENNVFVCSTTGEPVLNCATGFDPVNADYNIYYETGGAIFHEDTTTYAAGFADWQTAGFDPNGMNADPVLANISAGSEDLHLQGSSPAIGAATGSAPADDIDRETRATPDIGADESLSAAAPSITSSAATSGTVGFQYTYFIHVLDNGASSTLSLGAGAPGWLTLSGNTLFGTPTVAGTYGPFDLTATNSAGSDTESITIVVTQPQPEIGITGPNAAPVASGDTLDIYAALAGVSSLGTFTIANSGSADLNLTGTTLVDVGTSESNCAVVVTQPTINPITALSSDVFDIDVIPGGAGTFSFTLTILNDDTDEGTFTINFTGEAKAAAEAEIAVWDFNDANITSGGTVSETNTGTAIFNRTFTIRNEGGLALNLTGTTEVAVSGENNCTVGINQPASNSLAAATTWLATTEGFSLDITPSGSGSFSFTVTIVNNDLDEGTFTFTYNGNTAGGGGGGGGGGDGGCSTGTDGFNWLALMGLLGVVALGIRMRASKN